MIDTCEDQKHQKKNTAHGEVCVCVPHVTIPQERSLHCLGIKFKCLRSRYIYIRHVHYIMDVASTHLYAHALQNQLVLLALLCAAGSQHRICLSDPLGQPWEQQPLRQV